MFIAFSFFHSFSFQSLFTSAELILKHQTCYIYTGVLYQNQPFFASFPAIESPFCGMYSMTCQKAVENVVSIFHSPSVLLPLILFINYP